MLLCITIIPKSLYNGTLQTTIGFFFSNQYCCSFIFSNLNLFYSADADLAAISPAVRTEEVMKQTTIRPRRPRYSYSVSLTVDRCKLADDQWNNFLKSCYSAAVTFIQFESLVLKTDSSPNSSAAASFRLMSSLFMLQH